MPCTRRTYAPRACVARMGFRGNVSIMSVVSSYLAASLCDIFPAGNLIREIHVARALHVIYVLHVRPTCQYPIHWLCREGPGSCSPMVTKFDLPSLRHSTARDRAGGLTWHVLYTCISKNLHFSGFWDYHHRNLGSILHMTI